MQSDVFGNDSYCFYSANYTQLYLCLDKYTMKVNLYNDYYAIQCYIFFYPIFLNNIIEQLLLLAIIKQKLFVSFFLSYIKS